MGAYSDQVHEVAPPQIQDTMRLDDVHEVPQSTPVRELDGPGLPSHTLYDVEKLYPLEGRDERLADHPCDATRQETLPELLHGHGGLRVLAHLQT